MSITIDQEIMTLKQILDQIAILVNDGQNKIYSQTNDEFENCKELRKLRILATKISAINEILDECTDIRMTQNYGILQTRTDVSQNGKKWAIIETISGIDHFPENASE